MGRGPLRGGHLIPYLACMAVYAALVTAHGHMLCPYTPDSLWYADVARFIARGQGMRCNITLASELTTLPRTFYGWPPLYPLVGAVVMKTGLDPLVAMHVVSIASFLLLPVPLIRLGIRLWGPVPAVCATAAVALLPSIFSLSGHALSEPLFLLLLAGALAALLHNSDAIGRPVVAGFLLGLAGLTRLAAGVFVPPLGMSVLAGTRGRRRWRDAILSVGLFMATAGLWAARNSLATGGPSGIEEPALSERFLPVLAACVQRLFWEMVSVGSFGPAAASQWKVAVVILVALAIFLRLLRTPAQRILVLWGGAYFVGIAWLRTQGPFDSPSGGRTLAPALVIIAFWLTGSLWANVFAESGPRRAISLVCGAALLGGLVFGRSYDLIRTLPKGQPPCSLIICDTPGLALLDSLAVPGEPVISNVAFKTAFCQDRPSVQLPIRPYSAMTLNADVLAGLGRFHGARFVYVEDTSARGTRSHDPMVYALLRGGPVRGLTPLLQTESAVLCQLVLTAR